MQHLLCRSVTSVSYVSAFEIIIVSDMLLLPVYVFRYI